VAISGSFSGTSKDGQTFEILIKETGAKKTEKALGRVNQSTNTLTDTVIRYGAAYFGARGIISGISKTLGLYIEQEKAERRLAAVAGRHTSELIDQAAAFQRVTVHGDETIMSVQRLLIQLGAKGPKEIKKATQASLELATALDMDLNSAARLVGQAMAGNVQTLARYIPAVRDLTKEQIAQGAAIDLIIEKLGGSAAAEADTLSGAMAQASNAAGDFGEVLGSKVAPAASWAARSVTRLSIALQQLDSGKLSETLALARIAGFDLSEFGPLGGTVDPVALGKKLGRMKAGLQTPKQRLAAELERRASDEREGFNVAGAFENARGPGGKTAGAIIAKQFAEALSADDALAKWSAAEVALDAAKFGELGTFGETEALDERSNNETILFLFEEMETEKTRIHDEELQKRADADRMVAEQMTRNMTNAAVDAAEASMQAYGQFFGQLLGANRKTMHKIQKAMLFIEGGMAVTRGVIALQTAIATLVQTEGASAADIPGAAALIQSGTMMMAGQLLTSGRGGGGGGGGGGRGVRAPGIGGSQGTVNHITLNVGGLVHDEGTLGATVSKAMDRAKEEGRI
jgi:hypothetical protein